MDKIYGAALLTIVAADGEDANVGLPGVRPGTRTRNFDQLCEEVWPDLYLATTIESPLDPAGSVWASRGWTFQEQLLSGRLLLFYQGGVHWQCRKAFFYEDAPAATKIEPEQPCRLEQLSPRWAAPPRIIEKQAGENQDDYVPGPLFRPAVFVEYAKAVKEYTKRRLTFSDDILNAFEGISSRLSDHFGSSFLAALPETYLEVALLWTPVVLQTRRESHSALFPSWSWAGWEGQAECTAVGPDGREWIESTIKWYIKDGPLASRLANEVGIGIDEVSLGCSLSSNSLSWMPIFESAAGFSGEVPAVELPNMRSPYLQLWTSCSFFTIVHRSWRTPDEIQMSSSVRRPIQAQIHCATGSRRQHAGYLTLNGDGPYEIVKGKYEFIVLSGAKVMGYDSISGNVKYSDEAQMYNVMLVEWDHTHQIASRLGIGRIFKQAWDMSLPIIRFVTIG